MDKIQGGFFMSFRFKFDDCDTARRAMEACDKAGANWETVRTHGCVTRTLDIEHIEKETPAKAQEIISILRAYGGKED